MPKVCEKHPNSPRYKYRCLLCGREKALLWNRKNRELCLKRNKEYGVIKKEKIAMRKKARYTENPKKYSAQARKTMLKNKYGLSVEQYDSMLKEQGGVCAICKQKETIVSNKKGGVDSLRVDHCHKSSQVRGLLCQNCNFGLGHFKDNIMLLKTAIDYLNRFPY
jgi:DNA-directed RNA polymerase subunit RPC12/RpoP